MKRIKFQDKEWLFVGDDLAEGGPIATDEAYSNGHASYAHLFPDGVIRRFSEQIGRVFDIEVLGDCYKDEISMTILSQHPGSARFHELLKEIGDLHNRKQNDYGRDDDPFANVRASAAFGVKPWVGALVRLNDKIIRLQSLIAKGKLANESAEDSMRDVAVYALIALVLFEQEKND